MNSLYSHIAETLKTKVGVRSQEPAYATLARGLISPDGTVIVAYAGLNNKLIDPFEAVVGVGKSKAACVAATTANITIATALNNGDTLDGVTLATNDRVLVKNQTAPEENGIYIVGVTPVRATDMNNWIEFPGALVGVVGGTANAGTSYIGIAADSGTVGTTAVVFNPYPSGAGFTSPVFTTGIVAGSTTMALFNTVATTINLGAAATGAINIGNASGQINVTAGVLAPTTNDGTALGDATHNFSDLFLASGALINVANGNAVITHSSGVFTISTGDLRITTAGTNSASSVTVGGTQTLTNKTLTNPVVNSAAVARTATSDGLTTGTIADAGFRQHITVTSASADNIIVLPTPTIGVQVILNVAANGFELRTDTPASVAINGGTGANAESAIPASSTVVMICVAANAWKGYFMDADGDLAKVEAAAT